MKKIHHKILKRKTSLLLIVGILSVFLLTNKSTIDFVKAAANSVGGWAWGGSESSDGAYKGIGWLSFGNNADGSIIDYGVNVPSGNGLITGNAWSENYGWLSFNQSDLTGCPSTAPATITASITNPGVSDVTGWARFLSVKNAIAQNNAGGWLGCVSLSSLNMGDAIKYGVTKVGSVFSGYAWSDELGWIDFSRVGANKSVTISPLSTTIKQGQSISFSSNANFADGSMVGHNINWKKSGGCWNWESCFVSNGSTITNSTSAFADTSSHTLSNVVFTPTAIGTYNLYAAATSSSPSETLWIDSPIATVNVVFPGCDFFGNLVDTGSVVTTYSSANSANCASISRQSTCQNVANVGVFSPALLSYQTCSAGSGAATPISVNVSSATINSGDTVAVTWNIDNPDNTCYIEAATSDISADAIAKTIELNKTFEGFSPNPSGFTLPVSPTLYTDSNDPYGISRTMQSAIQTKYNSAVSTRARGQKTVQLFYSTTFTARCTSNSSVTSPRGIRVNVSHNEEG